MQNIVFLHPDLGIGGAERLIVDAALALKSIGHEVCIVTSHHDPAHCFPETKDGTLPVTVVGDWIPRSIFGYCFAVCAYIRMIYAAFYVIFFSNLNPDVVFCDLVSACVPVLRMRTKVLFYCHFPDQLLSKPGGTLKSVYRWPLNWLEERTTGQADKILVNSKFTASVFAKTFRNIKKCPDVLYPSISLGDIDTEQVIPIDKVLQCKLPENNIIFLSINRYERKKNLNLALEAFMHLQLLVDENVWPFLHLVIAGGYDNRVSENVEYYEELNLLREELHITEKVTFLKSPTDAEKISLLNYCHCLLYTPANEHFGIVPLEAMNAGKPVIAVNSGGPRETVLDSETGFLCEPQAEAFAKAMLKCINDKTLRAEMGRKGQERVKTMFSFTSFTSQLDAIIQNMLVKEKTN